MNKARLTRSPIYKLLTQGTKSRLNRLRRWEVIEKVVVLEVSREMERDMLNFERMSWGLPPLKDHKNNEEGD